jgi:hypothetical protein
VSRACAKAAVALALAALATGLYLAGPATAQPQPLFRENPAGPIRLQGKPNSLVAGISEGFTSGEGLGSVLVGYDARKSSEILWNTPEGLFYLSSYHPPRGPGRVTGAYDDFGVIDSSHRLLRLYGEFDDRYRIRRIVRTGAAPVGLIQQFGDLAILNSGSADLWLYVSDTHGRPLPATKVPLGGKPTDLAGTSLYGRPLFVSDTATDSVTVLYDLEEGSFQLKRTLPVGENPVDLALGQLFPDPEPEVAVANRGSDSVAILDGPHTRNYDSPDYRRVATYPAGDEPVAIRAVNLDGRAGGDLAVVDAGSDRLTVLLNDGHGHFHRERSYPTGHSPVAVAAISSWDRTFGPDLIVANHGSRTLTVLLRHEPGICRGREARPVTGTDADDALHGVSGVDLLRGRGGEDRIFGNAGGDCIYGGGGDDFILGRSGGDLIEGGPGDDRIYGGLPEFLRNRGRDKIIGGSGRDSIHAGSADDVIRAVDGERDLVDCAPGRDVAYVDLDDRLVGCERVQVGGY